MKDEKRREWKEDTERDGRRSGVRYCECGKRYKVDENDPDMGLCAKCWMEQDDEAI